ncbi:MAG: EamA family transporter [Methanomicrobiales archaeon]|nr:EamA family transporter [Methanomicrobiales archaeon]MDI6875484.1 EamA family transporter [Methanomicrobiales archaeon]
MPSWSRNPLIFGLMTAALFGVGTPFSKLLLSEVHPLTLSALLYIGSGIGTLGLLLLVTRDGNGRAHREAALQRGDLPWLCGVIVFGGFLAPIALMNGLANTPAETAALLLNFEAVATTLIAASLFRESIGSRVWLALALVTASCIILSWDPQAIGGISIPALGVILSTVFWSLDNNVARNISAKDPIVIVSLKGLLGGSMAFAAALMLGAAWPDLNTTVAAMILGFTSFGGLTSMLFIHALRGIGTARSASLLAVSPLFGVTVSLLIFAEIPDLRFFLAAPVMACGVYLLVAERHSHEHRHEPLIHEHRHCHDDLHHNHEHSAETPPPGPDGEHSHLHRHPERVHDHPHRPDIHHRHLHRRS